jgi:hypothetical protein
LFHILSPTLFTYLDPPAHNTWAPTNAAYGIFWLAKGIHAPSHQSRAPCKTVVDKNQMIIGIVKEVALDDTVKDILWFSA